VYKPDKKKGEWYNLNMLLSDILSVESLL